MSKDLNYTLSLKDLFSKQMRGAADSTTRMDSAMSKLSGVIGGAFAVGSVVSFGKAVIESLKNYEYFHASLKTMLHGNIGATNALEKQLVSLAKTTPFELVQVQKATKQLLAYGFKAGEVVQTMRTLGDVSSGVGAPLEDIAYLYGTLKTSGRVTLMDLRQFAGRGIPIYETLAKRLNTTTESINTMVSAGKIGFKDVEGAFKDMTSQGGQFFNLMAEQSQTVGGKLSNMADAFEQLKVNIGKSQTGIIAGTVSFIGSLVDNLNRGIDAINLMDTAFKNTKSSQYSFYEKYMSSLGGKIALKLGLKPTEGGYTEMQQYASGMQQNLGATSKDKLSATQNNSTISNIIRNIFADSKMSYIEKNRRVGILQEIRKQNLDAIGLFDMKSDKNATEKEKLASLKPSAQNSGVNITAARPQSLTINITKLVENLNLSTQTLKEGTSKIREEISKVFLEMVNDANLITR